VNVSKAPVDGIEIAVLELGRKPANALSLEFCVEISRAIREIREDHPDVTAAVVTSSLPSGIFSAGIDAPTELYRPDRDRLPEFWRSFQDLFLDLYGCADLTTVAAIEGPAPAGGCMLASSCDYRVALRRSGSDGGGGGGGSPMIGLNESHLGIAAPPWMCRQYVDLLGHRRAELALLRGTLFRPDEALAVGLVDELVEEEEDATDDDEDGRSSPVVRAALARARELAGIPPAARSSTKKLTRGPLVETLTRDRERDVDYFCEFVTAEPVQEALRAYLESLAKKRAAAKKKATAKQQQQKQ